MGNHLQVSKFYEQDSNKKVNLEALKQKTIKELSKYDEKMDTGVFHPEDNDKDSGYSIEEKENISK